LAQPVTPGTTTPFQTPDTSSCPNKLTPPAPVDLSEAPAPGAAPLVPLPIPAEAVGGTRMAECGVVLPRGAAPLPEGLSAYSWLVADLDTGAVLAARDPHARHRPASCIKILTALVAVRELDAKAEVVGTDADAGVEGSRVGIGPDGRYTVDQLLHGLLMRSGNDAAHALAEQLGGVPQTVTKMNALARSLGALDTRAATPSGLDAPGTSTSAYDLGVIFRVAMRSPEFASIVGTSLYDFPGFRDKPGFIVSNDNRLLLNYPGALGGKTGFTDDARHTYVGAAARGQRRLLVVLMRGEQLPVPMWQQATSLLDYGFAFPPSTPSVGVLVDRAPTPPATRTPTVTPTPAAAQPTTPTTHTPATAYLALLALTTLLAAAVFAVLRRVRRSM
jgi:serine-type D-Ala-D-Ala carboxypeptidase (penicillin-binding protein 5/6)